MVQDALDTIPRRFALVDGNHRVTGLVHHCPRIETLHNEVQLLDCDMDDRMQLLMTSMQYNHDNETRGMYCMPAYPFYAIV